LAADDATEATVAPTSVTILANQTSATATVAGVIDTLVDDNAFAADHTYSDGGI
jgi:hypothetical protein